MTLKPKTEDVRDAITHVAMSVFDILDFDDLSPADFELASVEMMTVDDLSDYAGMDISSGYMFAERGELIPYVNDPVRLIEEANAMGSSESRDFSHSLKQLRRFGVFSPVVVLEGKWRGRPFREFGDGWGRVNLAEALDVELPVATLRLKGRRRARRAAGDYYDAYRGITIDEVVDRWARHGAKMYDRSMPVWFPAESLWPYREYTWTRETARESFRGRGKRPDTSYWDNLTASLDAYGWDPGNPAIVQIGENGVAKVGEGNHRLAIARGIDPRLAVPVMFLFQQQVHVDPKLREDPWYRPPQTRTRTKAKTKPKRTEPITPEEQEKIDELMELLRQGRRW